MTPEIQALPFDQLLALHREILTLINHKRSEAVEELKVRFKLLGLTPEDFAPPRRKRGRKPRQQQEEAHDQDMPE